jgi:hypothetical protein
LSQLWGVTGVDYVHDLLLPDVVQIFRQLWYVVGGVHDHIAGGHGSRNQQACQPTSAKINDNILKKEKKEDDMMKLTILRGNSAQKVAMISSFAS